MISGLGDDPALEAAPDPVTRTAHALSVHRSLCPGVPPCPECVDLAAAFRRAVTGRASTEARGERDLNDSALTAAIQED